MGWNGRWVYRAENPFAFDRIHKGIPCFWDALVNLSPGFQSKIKKHRRCSCVNRRPDSHRFSGYYSDFDPICLCPFYLLAWNFLIPWFNPAVIKWYLSGEIMSRSNKILKAWHLLHTFCPWKIDWSKVVNHFVRLHRQAFRSGLFLFLLSSTATQKKNQKINYSNLYYASSKKKKTLVLCKWYW